MNPQQKEHSEWIKENRESFQKPLLFPRYDRWIGICRRVYSSTRLRAIRRMAGLIDGNYLTIINALAQRGTLIAIWVFV